jgi:hypothetical protein
VAPHRPSSFPSARTRPLRRAAHPLQPLRLRRRTPRSPLRSGRRRCLLRPWCCHQALLPSTFTCVFPRGLCRFTLIPGRGRLLLCPMLVTPPHFLRWPLLRQRRPPSLTEQELALALALALALELLVSVHDRRQHLRRPRPNRLAHRLMLLPPQQRRDRHERRPPLLLRRRHRWFQHQHQQRHEAMLVLLQLLHQLQVLPSLPPPRITPTLTPSSSKPSRTASRPMSCCRRQASGMVNAMCASQGTRTACDSCGHASMGTRTADLLPRCTLQARRKQPPRRKLPKLPKLLRFLVLGLVPQAVPVLVPVPVAVAVSHSVPLSPATCVWDFYPCGKSCSIYTYAPLFTSCRNSTCTRQRSFSFLF